MIVSIPRSGDGCKPGEYDAEWLPRQCPACGQIAIIGHGRRRRQAHDGWHDASLPAADPVVIDAAAVFERLSTGARVLDLYRQQNPTASQKPLQLLLRRLVRVRSRFQKLLSSAKSEK